MGTVGNLRNPSGWHCFNKLHVQLSEQDVKYQYDITYFCDPQKIITLRRTIVLLCYSFKLFPTKM